MGQGEPAGRIDVLLGWVEHGQKVARLIAIKRRKPVRLDNAAACDEGQRGVACSGLIQRAGPIHNCDVDFEGLVNVLHDLNSDSDAGDLEARSDLIVRPRVQAEFGKGLAIVEAEVFQLLS